jgi:hypothetical protein
MTPIIITGALTMTSLNGDGPQLLTEAAEFLSALAQMGVQMAVEINLRPQAAEKASAPVLLNPGPPVDLALRTADSVSVVGPLHILPRRGSADDITLYEGHPSPSPRRWTLPRRPRPSRRSRPSTCRCGQP